MPPANSYTVLGGALPRGDSTGQVGMRFCVRCFVRYDYSTREKAFIKSCRLIYDAWNGSGNRLMPIYVALRFCIDVLGGKNINARNITGDKQNKK